MVVVFSLWNVQLFPYPSNVHTILVYLVVLVSSRLLLACLCVSANDVTIDAEIKLLLLKIHALWLTILITKYIFHSLCRWSHVSCRDI